MNRIFLVLFCLSTICSLSQSHQLIDTTDYQKRKALSKNFEIKYKFFNEQIKSSYKGAMRKEVLSFYKGSQSHFLEIIKNKKLLFEDRFQKYTDSLYFSLKQKNPILKNEDISFYLTKTPVPNAFSIGDGTIIINIGLFSFFENEHQLLSVISHEVAHQVLEHAKKSINKKAQINSSVLSNRSDISKSIRAEKYNKGTRSFSLLKNLMYVHGEERRQQEIEADSLGYILYRNTSSQKNDFINALLLLKQYDSVPSIKIDSAAYSKIFNIPEQIFKSKWLKNEDFEKYNYTFYQSKINLDSLKGHPEIEDRILKLKSSFSELNNQSKTTLSNSNLFNTLKKIAKQSSIENYYYLNEYGLSIYLIINRLDKKNDNSSYYKKWLGINFEALYQAKKKYQLNRYVDRLSPKSQSASYQQFLNFIWNLNLEEIKMIANYYNTY